jgi:hypothetical protein
MDGCMHACEVRAAQCYGSTEPTMMALSEKPNTMKGSPAETATVNSMAAPGTPA